MCGLTFSRGCCHRNKFISIDFTGMYVGRIYSGRFAERIDSRTSSLFFSALPRVFARTIRTATGRCTGWGIPPELGYNACGPGEIAKVGTQSHDEKRSRAGSKHRVRVPSSERFSAAKKGVRAAVPRQYVVTGGTKHRVGIFRISRGNESLLEHHH